MNDTHQKQNTLAMFIVTLIRLELCPERHKTGNHTLDNLIVFWGNLTRAWPAKDGNI